MVMVIVGGGQGGMEMTTVWRTIRTRTRSGQEEEEEEEQQHPFQKDLVDVTNFLHLFNRRVTPPIPSDS
jgi:NADH dehydrogenase FAD-containing subunit